MCFVIVLFDGFDMVVIGFIVLLLFGEWNFIKFDFVFVLSVVLFGFVCGVFVLGLLFDWFGCCLLLFGLVFLFGVVCLMFVFLNMIGYLIILCFIIGVGFGVVMLNVVMMMGEFCLDKCCVIVINLMFCGFLFGVVFGGFLVVWMILYFGWCSVLVFGGVMLLLFGVLLLLKMLELVCFMVVIGQFVDKICVMFVCILCDVLNVGLFVLIEVVLQIGGKGFGVVLLCLYIVGLVMLWFVYFMGFVIFYVLINWMLILLKDVGLMLKSVMLILVLFLFGGVGVVLCGVLMDCFNVNCVIVVCYVLMVVSVYVIGQVVGNVGLLVLVVFVVGVLMNIVQLLMLVLVVVFYLIEGCGMGVVWMFGVGCFGGIVGLFFVVELMCWYFLFVGVFVMIVIVGVFVCVVLLIKQMVCLYGVVQLVGKIELFGY